LPWHWGQYLRTHETRVAYSVVSRGHGAQRTEFQRGGWVCAAAKELERMSLVGERKRESKFG